MKRTLINYINNNISSNSNKFIIQSYKHCNIILKNILHCNTKYFSSNIKSSKQKNTYNNLSVNHHTNINLKNNAIIKTQRQLAKNIRTDIMESIENVEALKTEQDREIFFNKIDALNYFKNLNSDYESFFSQRSFNIENFNFLLQILSKKSSNLLINPDYIHYNHKSMNNIDNNKQEQFNNIVDNIKDIIYNKMHDLNILPNVQSYLHLLTAYSTNGLIDESLKVFNDITSIFKTHNVYIYNSLMTAYANNGKAEECESLINQMKSEGLEPDVVCYTTLIHAYTKQYNYDKAWEVYNNLEKLNNDINSELEMLSSNNSLLNKQKGEVKFLSKPLIEDEYLTSYMIKICEKTHDAEKALYLFRKMEDKGFVPTTLYFNSIILALSSRITYASQAIDMYTKMKLLNVAPDLTTFSALLKATSKLGDIYTANELIKELKAMGYDINKYIITGLIKTYAGAIRNPLTKKELIEDYIKDSWELVKLLEDMYYTDNQVINSFSCNAILEVHTSALKWDDVDNKVIPFFNKYGIKLDVNSYDLILRMLLRLKNLKAIAAVYKEMFVVSNIQPNQNIMNYMLETSMRLNDVNGIINFLRKLRVNNKTPQPHLLKILKNAKNMPDEVYLEIRSIKGDFKRKFTTTTFIRDTENYPRIKERGKVGTRINSRK